MNIQKIIKFIESKGFKEYGPGRHENYDQSWQKIFNKDEDNEVAVNLNFWEHSAHSALAEDAFELVIYTDSDSHATQIHLYSWNDLDKNIEKAYQEVEKFIKFLENN